MYASITPTLPTLEFGEITYPLVTTDMTITVKTGSGFKVVDFGKLNGVNALQIETLKTGKLWSITVERFIERFSDETYTTDDKRKVTKIEEFVGVVFEMAKMENTFTKD